jgi:hypothetical protein
MNTQSDRYKWLVLIDGQRRGPLTYDDLTRAAKEGLISADTPVWRSGWKNWHPARSVKGLVVERTSAPMTERSLSDRQMNERAMNEAPLAPDDTEWNDDQVSAPPEEVYQYAPPQHREARRSQPQPQDMVALRWDQQQREDDKDDIFADEWRMLAEQRPGQDRGKAVSKAASVPERVPRKAPVPHDDFADRHDVDYRPVLRRETAGEPVAARIGAFFKRATIGLGVALLLAGGGWVLIQSGAIKSLRPTTGSRMALINGSDLPSGVAGLPAVMALQRNDPAAFESFKKRYADSAANARNKDEEMTFARNALRKSVKHLLPISSGDVLLEITETSLSYLQGLQSTDPESCVWLSDDSKGARLKSNLARDLPIPYAREMLVLERIASTNPHMAIAPMSDEDAQPYFERVRNALRRQNVRTDLQQHERLEPSEFAPYCALVIAFYQAVLDLPRDDKINVLRNLYAKAAVNADSDLKR